MSNPFTAMNPGELREFRAWLNLRYKVGDYTLESTLRRGWVSSAALPDAVRTELNRVRRDSYGQLRTVFRSLHALKEAQKKDLDPGRMMSRGALLVALRYDEITYRRAAYLLARDHDLRSEIKRTQVKTERLTLAPEGAKDGEQITLSLKDAHMTREEAERVNAALPDRLKIPSLTPKEQPLWDPARDARARDVIRGLRRPAALEGSITGTLTPEGMTLFKKTFQPDRRLIGMTISVDPGGFKTGAEIEPGMMVAINGAGEIVPARTVDLEAGQRTAEDPRYTSWLRTPDGHLVRRAAYDPSTHGMSAEPYTTVLRMRPKDRGLIPFDALAEEVARHGWVWDLSGSTYTFAEARVLANGTEFLGVANSRQDGDTGVEIMKRLALFDALKKAVTDLLSNEPALGLGGLKALCGERGWGHRTDYLGLNAGATVKILIPGGLGLMRSCNGTGQTILEAFWSAYRDAQRKKYV